MRRDIREIITFLMNKNNIHKIIVFIQDRKISVSYGASYESQEKDSDSG